MPLTAARGSLHRSMMHGETAMASKAKDGVALWRVVGWGLAAVLLLLPLVAMQFTSDVHWTPFDFFFAAVIIGSVGLLFELAVRMNPNRHYRIGVGFALAAAFFLVWVNGAVGMIGDEDNPYNLWFIALIPLALLGSAASRFRASGMAWVMAVAAVGQLLIAGFGASTDPRGGLFSALFAFPWLASALFFRAAARNGD
jgi:hypothetical protein